MADEAKKYIQKALDAPELGNRLTAVNQLGRLALVHPNGIKPEHLETLVAGLSPANATYPGGDDIANSLPYTGPTPNSERAFNALHAIIDGVRRNLLNKPGKTHPSIIVAEPSLNLSMGDALNTAKEKKLALVRTGEGPVFTYDDKKDVPSILSGAVPCRRYTPPELVLSMVQADLAPEIKGKINAAAAAMLARAIQREWPGAQEQNAPFKSALLKYSTETRQPDAGENDDKGSFADRYDPARRDAAERKER
jgi:hypothetical protein